MADGHHWVPKAVIEQLIKWLSPDAYAVFKRSVTTNPDGLWHGYGSPNGDPSLKHSKYNEEVLKAVQAEIGRLEKEKQLEGGKLSGKQATDIVKRIKKDGLGNSYVRKFNRAVLKPLRLLALGGIVAKGLEQAAKAEKLADTVSKSGHYRNALVALQKGDWRKANAEIQGGFPGGDNLIDDLIVAGYAREAMILQRRWQERENDFIKIEHEQAVPGVPDDF